MSKEVANSIERKNLHTPVYGVKEFVCLSVTKFDPNYIRTGKTEWAKKIKDIYDKKLCLEKFCLSEKWLGGPGPGPKL